MAKDKKTCKECQEEISIKAKKCPHCRSDQRNWINRHPILTVILFLFFFPMLIGAFNASDSNNDQKTTKSVTPVRRDDFIASVSFTGSQFVISNLDDLDCINSTIEVNGGFLKGGYKLDGYTLESGETYEVGALQFADKDGQRFNPFTHKPQDIFIQCQGTNELQYASYLGQF